MQCRVKARRYREALLRLTFAFVRPSTTQEKERRAHHFKRRSTASYGQHSIASDLYLPAYVIVETDCKRKSNCLTFACHYTRRSTSPYSQVSFEVRQIPCACNVPEQTNNIHIYHKASTDRQKEDTLAVSVLARLFFVLIIPIENSFPRSCSVIFIRNSSLASSVCTEVDHGKVDA